MVNWLIIDPCFLIPAFRTLFDLNPRARIAERCTLSK